MDLIWALTLCANAVLLLVLWRKRPADSGLLWASQLEALVSTSVMLCAEYWLPADHGLNDAMYNRLWTWCDLADVWAEGMVLVWVMRRDRAKTWVGSVAFIGMAYHLSVKLTEYWLHDPNVLSAWMPLLAERRWLNIFNIAVLGVLVYKRGATAQQEKNMSISKTREEATAALAGRQWDCDITEILDAIYGPEVTTNADSGDDGDNGSGPRDGGGH